MPGGMSMPPGISPGGFPAGVPLSAMPPTVRGPRPSNPMLSDAHIIRPRKTHRPDWGNPCCRLPGIWFFGLSVRTYLETKRADYAKLVAKAQDLKNEVRPYQDKVAHLKKLMESSHLNPAKLSRATVVAEAQLPQFENAAAAAGIQVRAGS